MVYGAHYHTLFPIHSTIFGIASAVGGQLRGPGFGCGFSIFILQVSAPAHSGRSIVANECCFNHAAHARVLELHALLYRSQSPVRFTLHPHATLTIQLFPLNSSHRLTFASWRLINISTYLFVISYVGLLSSMESTDVGWRSSTSWGLHSWPSYSPSRRTLLDNMGA